MGGRRDARIIGENGNLWDSASVAYNGTSASFDTLNYPNISIIVNAGANVTLNFEVSPDGQNWTFCENITQNLPQGGSSTAHVYETVGARYMRLVRADTDSDPNVTITATIQAKP